ncbi:LysE family translocator [Burkholderia cepacia]|uniref:LysE family translocator n=1 Tax=Burkholderia cepacia TaxID=292 RepID=UPI002AB7744B|nr:LysE family translocator [Burkholderia cepacia]
MLPGQYWLFVPACFAINMVLGPNNLLALSNGARSGVRAAILAASGRLVAFAAMIALTALGLGAVLMASRVIYRALQLAGAAYLIWLDVRLMLADPAHLVGVGANRQENQSANHLGRLSRQEFWVAVCNPKALLVFSAFFPNFVERSAYAQSFVILGATFLVLEVFAIAIYAAIGSRVRTLTNPGRLSGFNRGSGIVMILFGLLLAFTDGW